MPIPNNYDLDSVFKLAGFPYGRPLAERPENYIESGVNNWDTIVSLFDDDYLNYMAEHIVGRATDIPLIASDNPVFDHLLAAEILNTLTDAGYNPIGRGLDVTRVNYGDVSEDFEDGDAVRQKQRRVVASLRARASYLEGRIPSRRVSTAFDETDINPVHIERRTINIPNFDVIPSGSSSDMFELNAGAYIGTLRYQLVDDVGRAFKQRINNITTGEPVWEIDFPTPLPRDDSFEAQFTILLTDDAELELYIEDATFTATDIVLELYPLWGVNQVINQAPTRFELPDVSLDAGATFTLPEPFVFEAGIYLVTGQWQFDRLFTRPHVELRDEDDNIISIFGGGFQTAVFKATRAIILDTRTTVRAKFVGDDSFAVTFQNISGNIIQLARFTTLVERVPTGSVTLNELAPDVLARLVETDNITLDDLASDVVDKLLGNANVVQANLHADIVAKLLGSNNVAIGNLSDALLARILPSPLGNPKQALLIDEDGTGVEWGNVIAVVSVNSVGLAQLKDEVAGRLVPVITNQSRGVLALDAARNPVWFPFTPPTPTLIGDRGKPLVAIENPNDDTDTISKYTELTLDGLANEVKARMFPTFTGNKGKIPVVNSGETGVEYEDKPTGGGAFPTTRTTLLTLSLSTQNVSGTNRNVFVPSGTTLSENILPNTLYEVLVNFGTAFSTQTRDRALALSPADDEADFDFWFTPSGTTVRTIGSNVVTSILNIQLKVGSNVVGGQLTTGSGSRQTIRVNKLT